MGDFLLSIDSTRAVSKKAADSGFFRPRMISLVMVALILTLDFARGGFPAAEPSFRAGLRGNGRFMSCRLIVLRSRFLLRRYILFFCEVDSACALSKIAAVRQLFLTTNDFACFWLRSY